MNLFCHNVTENVYKLGSVVPCWVDVEGRTPFEPIHEVPQLTPLEHEKKTGISYPKENIIIHYQFASVL